MLRTDKDKETDEPKLNPIAQELCASLGDSTPWHLLSARGKRMYFPKGIIAQSAEAGLKASRYNATIGMACEGGKPLILEALSRQMPGLANAEAVAYAPTGGVHALRELWRDEMLAKNPGLAGALLTLPMVVPGLTAGLSLVSELFMSPGQAVVVPDLNWPNYRFMLEERMGARILAFPTFKAGTKGSSAYSIDIDAFKAAMIAGCDTSTSPGTVRCILNFPNNPTGYSPTVEEARALCEVLKELATTYRVLAILDDAYSGLQYEQGLYPESLFSMLAGCSKHLLAIKIDGPTKEYYSWGLRIGFVTFGCPEMGQRKGKELEEKLMGLIRCSVSNSSMPAQNMLVKVLRDPGVPAERQRFKALLESRYHEVKKALAGNAMPPCLEALPCNSGYFMTFRCTGISADELRQTLLDREGIGTISIADQYLRVAFSSVDKKDIEDFINRIFECAGLMGLTHHKKGRF